MLKLYLQILLVVTTILGILGSTGWLLLTYLYFNHEVGKGEDVSLDLMQISFALVIFLVNVGILALTVRWIKKTKSLHREKIKRYEQFGSS